MSESTAPATARGMLWGIKRSFLEYVSRMPDSAMSVTDGAVDTSLGFIFPVADAAGFDPARGEGSLVFAGDVRMRGHAGMLAVRVADPIVTVGANGARLTVTDVSGNPLHIANLGAPRRAPGGGIELPAQLAADAVPYFNDVYPEGTELDPLTIRGI
ncbi:HtaA domain-containing protein [Gulosibacter chungangensis]|uniref:Htaa domain-containing protein n=1 Tax=Gulosibacter chungangensis TaxID=979746 RepID=A0A7J5BFX5_9MICO|nr:HtaA domain-containing protein [Gulosibacter chungangensis]KAB1645134.1 hypothetical protein F8O05_02440 [Gulosibacter chungangensis]